ncbi:acyltransferase [Parabacteroides sp. FAFU027]|uniref:acyltransferase n=1 Tax=Parabacteroides sp. FAFU027 TaxID=2922715 RepID=UPI001FAE7809|nr:acyltransferase [Parabacteroides sp. FAFU027]
MMIFRKCIEVINTNFVRFFSFGEFKGSLFYFVKITGGKNNRINTYRSRFSKSRILFSGKNNKLSIYDSEILETSITVKGQNNVIQIDKDVKLRKANIIIRGSNCTLKIGAGTTFGQIRIVNVGRNNSVIIGTNCLFADNIEVWASDTHSIYDADGRFINPERPIYIGNGVWIGSYVKILKGVNIGDGAIVGMNSLIVNDVDSKNLVAGNPVRCLKENVTWSLKYEHE